MAMFDEIGELLTGGSKLGELAKALGGEESAVKTAATAAVPLLLGGLQKRSSSPTGAQALFDMVSKDNGSVLDNVSGLIGGPDSSGLGSTLVGSILGGRRNDIEATLASSSGLPLGAIAKFLPMVAPLISGYLGRKQSKEGLDRDGLASAVAGERQVLEDVGFGQWLGLLDGGDPIGDDKGFQSGLAKIAGLGGLGTLGAAATQITLPTGGAAPVAGGVRPMDIRAPEPVSGLSATTAPATTTQPAAGARTETAGAARTTTASPVNPRGTARTDYAIGAPEKKGGGWLKWLLPLLLAVLLAFLLYSCFNNSDDTTTTDVETTTEQAVEATAVPTEAPEPTAVPTEAPTPEPTAVPEREPEPVVEEPVFEGYIPGRTLARAEDSGVFSVLLGAVEAANLTAALEADGPLTLLAPIDSAFDVLPEDLRNRIVNDPELLQRVLSYHVVEGELVARGLETGAVSAIDGSALFFNTDGFQPSVNGATILDSDLLTDNGVIQVIDRVLIPPTLVREMGITVNQALSLQPILFEVGSAELTAEGRSVLDGAVPFIASATDAFEIGGHTDSDGADDVNQALSQDRADAVLTYLIDQGIDPARLTAVGYGETTPIESNETAEGKAKNRRIEFTAR